MLSTNKTKNNKCEISIIMGSKSDWSTMQYSATTLNALEINFEVLVISAHRTPERLFSFAKEAKTRGIKVIIAGAGGAAHLPGMVASLTNLPILGVPIDGNHLRGLDSLLSIVQMPAGVPVGTLAIGEAGAKNAAILAASILALSNDTVQDNLAKWRDEQTSAVAKTPYE